MSALKSLKTHWLGIALCGGLMVLPVAAYAGASSEVATAAEHAGFSAAATTLRVAHMHLHHTLNCLVGPKGRGFNSKFMNPCAHIGHGAIPDTRDAHTRTKLEHIANQVRMALGIDRLPTVKKDALKIEAELKRVK